MGAENLGVCAHGAFWRDRAVRVGRYAVRIGRNCAIALQQSAIVKDVVAFGSEGKGHEYCKSVGVWVWHQTEGDIERDVGQIISLDVDAGDGVVP